MEMVVRPARRIKSFNFPVKCLRMSDAADSPCSKHHVLQERLGIPTSAGALDFNLGCSGFVYGLALAKGLITGGIASRILFLTAETYSKFTHPLDKSNQAIFGDGAAATLISTDGFAEIGNFSLGTDGRGFDKLIVRAGGLRNPEKMNDLQFLEGNPVSSDHLFMD
jgi:3-oxoacyl-[acyl-carrier-protein] synthase-3